MMGNTSRSRVQSEAAHFVRHRESLGGPVFIDWGVFAGVLAKVSVSVIVPVYNQASAIESCVKAVAENLPAGGFADYEIIIAEDGSTDGTLEAAKAISKKNPRVKISHQPRRGGKGAAICRGFRASKGGIVAFLDADQATRTSQLCELVRAAQRSGIAVGSRYLKNSVATRSAERLIASRAYNSLVRLLLGSRLSDHQCGFKAFQRGIALKLCGQVRDRQWFWDTEALVLAQREGFRIEEVAVSWHEQKDTKVRVGRDTLAMLSGLARLWLRLNI
jgi:glycosyltransferase involved in cell wall biosynthesis